MTDNQATGGNAYTVDVTPGCGGAGERNLASIASAQVTKASGTFTVTTALSAGTDKYFSWCAVEFSGLATSLMLDKIVSVADFNITTNDVTGTTATLSQADELVLTAMCVVGNNGTIAISVPATWNSLFTETNNGSNNPGGGAYKIVAATTAVTALWSHDNNVGGTNEAAEAIATYKMASGVAFMPLQSLERGQAINRGATR